MNADRDENEVWLVVQEWAAVADLDKRAITACLAANPALVEIAAFHCQQAAEKLLKAFCVVANQSFRKTHDLEELAAHVKTRFPQFADLIASTEAWADWNIAYRYPGEEFQSPLPSMLELEQAVVTLERLAASLQSLRSTR